MTSKEKAKELVDKFYQTTPNENYVNDPIGVGRYEAWKQAKQCALIAIDEALAFISYASHQDYLLSVKQEIEKL